MPQHAVPRTGPLVGLRVIELASLAPAPFACTVLSDLGAEVLRIDRPDAVAPRGEAAAGAAAQGASADASAGTAVTATHCPSVDASATAAAAYGASADASTAAAAPAANTAAAAATAGGIPAAPPPDPLGRGRRSVAVDLRDPRGAAILLRLVEHADVLVEGFRPGVCERLGIGPEECAARNAGLIYARMTGYGQDGPLAARAGHDINYLSLSGALEPLGPKDGPPLPPLNYVADFGGGGMLLAVGVLAALFERAKSGRGQVVDASMVEGSALITALLHGLRASGLWETQRGVNLFDGSAPFYATYACADGRFVAVGALEPKFWAQLLSGLGLADRTDLPSQHDRARWPELKAHIGEVFRTRTRDAWAAHFADTDACVTPVLSPFEAHLHPHNAARGTFTEVAGLVQPAPAPRFSRTPGRVASPAPQPGEHYAALTDWGIADEEVRALRAEGVVG